MMGVPVVMMAYSESDPGRFSKYVVDDVKIPHPEKAEAQFIDKLLHEAARFGDSVLFPASDEALAAVSRHKEVLEPHYLVACPTWEITRKLLDKKHTYALAEKVGVAAPKTVVPQSLEDVERYLDTATFPCLVKPSQSHLFFAHFKRKMFPVANAAELMSAYKRAAAAGLEVVLQELIPGEDGEGVNYNAYVADGEALAEFTAAKIRNAPPWYGSPRVVVSREVPEVLEPGRKILRALGFHGYACTEFKRDPRDGVYKLIEVNGRHNLSSALSIRCGINFPWLEYKHLTEGALPTAQHFETEVYWIDLTRDLGHSAMNLIKERFTLGQYLKPYLSPHVFAILDTKDPKPMLKKYAFLVRNALPLKATWRKEKPTEPRTQP